MHLSEFPERGGYLTALRRGGQGSTLVCIQSGNVKLRHLGAIKSHFQHMAQMEQVARFRVERTLCANTFLKFFVVVFSDAESSFKGIQTPA